MKTLLLTFECPPDVTGGGLCTYVQEYIAAKIERREPTVILTADFNVQDEVCTYFGCVKVIRFNPSAGDSFKYMGHWAAMSYEFSNQVKKIITDGFQPDWLEVCDGFGLGYFTLQRKLCLEAPFTDLKVLVTAHTPVTMIDEWDKKNIYELPTYFTKYMEQFCFMAADKVISPSNFLKKKLLTEFLEKEVPIDVIPNPYEKPFVPSKTGTDAAESSQIHDIPDYAIASRVCYWKGIDHALAGFDLYWSNGGQSSLYVYGSDTHYFKNNQSFKETLSTKYQKWIEKGLLKFAGLKEHSEILLIKKQLKALFHPSLCENYPYSVIEHMADGGIVAASLSGGQAEFISDTENGFLFDPQSPQSIQNAILKIDALNDAERHAIAQNAMTTIEKTCSYASVMTQKEQVLTTAQQQSARAAFPFTSGKELTHPAAQAAAALTVIIPHYNLGTLLVEAIESIKFSSLPNIKILVVDDGSTDKESIIILKTLEARYADLKVLYKKNSGVAETRNIGVQHATTKYIALLDADDLVCASYYEAALKILNRYSNVGFVGAWNEDFNQTGRLRLWPTFNPEIPLQMIMNTTNCQGLVVRRDAYLAHGRHDPELGMFLDDWEATISMVLNGVRGVMIPHPLFKYRIREESIFRDKFRMFNINYNYIIDKHQDKLSGTYGEIIKFLNANGPNTQYHNPTFPPERNTHPEPAQTAAPHHAEGRLVQLAHKYYDRVNQPGAIRDLRIGLRKLGAGQLMSRLRK
ncbi:MAG: glycosyltransferase [Acetobacter persici]|uniref:glycosyltransferase n=1 Tax=Acetobacter persici TaxID=1076596 RepID=UPI0039E8ACDE